MVMVSVTGYTAISDAHVQWAIQTEYDNGVPGNSDGPAPNLSPADRSYNRSNEAVIALRFDAVGIGSDGITLPIHRDRFKVEY
jgi:hypothetical protein